MIYIELHKFTHVFFEEEKKNRIKMEISRRRNQIEENARLHEELIRLAKLRETAELGGNPPVVTADIRDGNFEV